MEKPMAKEICIYILSISFLFTNMISRYIYIYIYEKKGALSVVNITNKFHY